MPGGGELAAVFRGLAQDTAQAGDDIGKSISRWMEDTADIEDENVARTLAADAENARALNAIRPNPGNLAEGGAGEGEFGKPSLISRLLGGAKPDTNKQIDETLGKLNPKFDPTKSAYSENCTGVVQANELRRRGIDVQPGPLEKHLWSSEGGPGGRPLDVISGPWGGNFAAGTKAEIEQAFKEPGSRGVVVIAWHRGGAHVFNVENVGGDVRFIDGQPTPPVTDASHYFGMGHSTGYIRLDNRPTPPENATKPYLEP